MPLKKKETNILNERNPNWQERDQLGIYNTWPRIWTRISRETNPACDRVGALNPEPPDYNTSALNHSAMVPPNIFQ